MKFNDIFRLSMNNLLHRGLRSWLTILGIVIGVAAVVGILSISAGLQESISSRLGGLGADILTITPGFSRAAGFAFAGSGGGSTFFTQSASSSKNLTTRDVEVIKAVPGVAVVDGIVSGRATASYLAQSASVSVQGVEPLAWRQMTTTSLGSGRYLSPGDANVVVIGYGIANNVFKQPLGVNTQITIGGQPFKIVGILEQSTGIGGGDNNVIMPVTAARNIVSDMTATQLSSIQVKVADVNALNDTSNAIESRLLLSRHVTGTTKDFTITSGAAIQATIASVLDTLNLFLGGIASISLLVGAIGIANTMFMSVMERTRQIGTLKALGATSFEVMKLFLFESAMLGLIGGLIGVFLGFIASGALSELGVRLNAASGAAAAGGTSSTLITPQLVLFAMGFSIAIGAIAGILPARSASKLQPIEALRYE
ncbi:MAG: ABC transporter permease [Candidatus Aenigmarchaeota archaeon]|nr:ABC transporter permease [Candidatus Aenigmarchaeota archaeon]